MASCILAAKPFLHTVLLVIILTDNVLLQESTEGENVNIWIQGCTINIKWNAVKNLASCSLQIYRVQLYKNQTGLPPVDTSALRYSLEGIDSESIYRVKITPIFKCTNNHQEEKTIEKSISTIPDDQSNFITRNISDSIKLTCIISGAYSPLSINWSHRKGINNKHVRSFTTSEITFEKLTYNDEGKYVCTVEFFKCGESTLRRKRTNSVTLSINGPPYLPTPLQTARVNFGDNLTLALSLISFPPPSNQIIIKNQNNKTVYRGTVTFEPATLSNVVYGSLVDEYSYDARLDLFNITKDWIGANEIIFSNGMGSKSYIFKIDIFKIEENFEKENFIVRFLRENKLLVAGVGGGFLALTTIIIVAVIIMDLKKKRRQRGLSLNINQNQQEMEALAAPNCSDHIYARPFSFGNVQHHAGKATPLSDNEKRIQIERHQCASMYSCAGFSLNEFQDDAIMYDNQFAPEYK